MSDLRLTLQGDLRGERAATAFPLPASAGGVAELDLRAVQAVDAWTACAARIWTMYTTMLLFTPVEIFPPRDPEVSDLFGFLFAPAQLPNRTSFDPARRSDLFDDPPVAGVLEAWRFRGRGGQVIAEELLDRFDVAVAEVRSFLAGQAGHIASVAAAFAEESPLDSYVACCVDFELDTIQLVVSNLSTTVAEAAVDADEFLTGVWAGDSEFDGLKEVEETADRLELDAELIVRAGEARLHWRSACPAVIEDAEGTLGFTAALMLHF